MSEMIERVARAMFESYHTHVSRDCWIRVSDEYKSAWHHKARAAIQAMRLPTDSMIQAGYDASESGLPLKKIHTAMIDAALQTE